MPYLKGKGREKGRLSSGKKGQTREGNVEL